MKNIDKANISKAKGRIIVLPNARKLTADEVVRCIFGKSLDNLVKEIRENKDGKYDSLYSNSGYQGGKGFEEQK